MPSKAYFIATSEALIIHLTKSRQLFFLIGAQFSIGMNCHVQMYQVFSILLIFKKHTCSVVEYNIGQHGGILVLSFVC